MKLRLRRWLPITGIIIDANWLYLGLLLNWANTSQGAFISELSANGQPYAGLFRGLDILVGLIWVIAAGLWLYGRRTIITNLFASTMLLLGTSNIIDAFLPLDCSETLSNKCRYDTTFSTFHSVHLYESCASVVLFVGIAVVLLILLKRSKQRGLLMLSTVAMLFAMLAWLIDTLYRFHNHLEGYGYVQRLFELIFIPWFVIFWHTALKRPNLLGKIYFRTGSRK